MTSGFSELDQCPKCRNFYFKGNTCGMCKLRDIPSVEGAFVYLTSKGAFKVEDGKFKKLVDDDLTLMGGPYHGKSWPNSPHAIIVGDYRYEIVGDLALYMGVE